MKLIRSSECCLLSNPSCSHHQCQRGSNYQKARYSRESTESVQTSRGTWNRKVSTTAVLWHNLLSGRIWSCTADVQEEWDLNWKQSPDLNSRELDLCTTPSICRLLGRKYPSFLFHESKSMIFLCICLEQSLVKIQFFYSTIPECRKFQVSVVVVLLL